jgi:hypothetical protein
VCEQRTVNLYSKKKEDSERLAKQAQVSLVRNKVVRNTFGVSGDLILLWDKM